MGKTYKEEPNDFKPKKKGKKGKPSQYKEFEEVNVDFTFGKESPFIEGIPVDDESNEED